MKYPKIVARESAILNAFSKAFKRDEKFVAEVINIINNLKALHCNDEMQLSVPDKWHLGYELAFVTVKFKLGFLTGLSGACRNRCTIYME